MSARSQAGTHLVIWRKIRRWIRASEEAGENPHTFIWLRWWIRQLAEMEIETPDVVELRDPLDVAGSAAS